jgi:hypothetical protein
MLAQVDYIPDSLGSWFDDPRWWLRSPSYQDRQIQAHGVPLPEIVEHLKLVYNESTCQQMLVNGYWAPLLGLFSAQPWIEWFGVMLALGVDLKKLGPERASHYYSGLRSGDQWWGSRVEAGIEAGLFSAGFAPVRPSLHSHEKQWDFSIEVGGMPFLIECKALSSGNADGNFELVEERFQNMGGVFQHDQRIDALWHFSPWMLNALHEYRVQMFYECVLPEFTEELTRTLARSTPDGTPRRLGRFGNLTLVPCTRDDGFLGRWETCGYENLLIHRMRRLMTMFGEATGNFKHALSGAHRIAVVWTGNDYLSSDDAAEFIERHIDQTFRAHKMRLDIDRRRLGFESGVLLGTHRDFDDEGFGNECARFQTERVQMMFPNSLLDALSSWRYHACVTRD